MEVKKSNNQPSTSWKTRKADSIAAGYLDREMGHWGNKQKVMFIGAGTGSMDSHPKAEAPSCSGAFPFIRILHFLISFHRRKVYFDGLVGRNGSDRPEPVVCATWAVTLKSPLPIMGSMWTTFNRYRKQLAWPLLPQYNSVWIWRPENQGATGI